MSHNHNRRNRIGGGGLYWRPAEGFTHERANRKMEDSKDRWLEKASWCEKDRVHKQPSVVVFLTIMWVRNGGSSHPFLFLLFSAYFFPSFLLYFITYFNFWKFSFLLLENKTSTFFLCSSTKTKNEPKVLQRWQHIQSRGII